ncbi:L-serine ammonia-lyase [Rhizorhabdus wittichii RW1]|uniref:L-serine dehydratase n=1 Tax=Rhizorhabdus wittichii (strain DSM 6014 / CCUG 31198 / JCM 15750 / NBRC 105917 / EY 4224 / RW1) TaxID=392499 RepID=A0A9J9HCW1_RHIWR|nr:L-serine ammonia-lyase [Rhizorhabdus wittichii RW1]
MVVSTFDIFKPGVGPSSSHTMGPMLAGHRFVRGLERAGTLASVQRVEVELLGSLAATGRGHGTDRAVQVGLAGFDPATVEPDDMSATLSAIATDRSLFLGGRHAVPFDPASDILWSKTPHKLHPNAVRFTALSGPQSVLESRLFFSVGGGFVVDEAEFKAAASADPQQADVRYAFASAAELLSLADNAGISIADLMRANERSRGATDEEIDLRLDAVWSRMAACVARGLQQEGELPGGLRVKRRARPVHDALRARPEMLIVDPLTAMDFVNVWALAVNEENAAGGAVVTAPTNGAAGIIPAVLMYFTKLRGGTDSGVRTLLLTAAAIGALYKRNASISGAEVGCQGEVGVACSMAAAGLTAALGGTNAQIENAAEIGMEHNLGLTCDPIGGLVQIPCIERNAMGAIKAIDASRLALLGDGTHHVSLDKVIATMRETGRDMHRRYKETSEGGLAVNVVEC